MQHKGRQILQWWRCLYFRNRLQKPSFKAAIKSHVLTICSASCLQGLCSKFSLGSYFCALTFYFTFYSRYYKHQKGKKNIHCKVFVEIMHITHHARTSDGAISIKPSNNLQRMLCGWLSTTTTINFNSITV